MNITLYWNFYKKDNSTKQPSPGVGHTEESMTVTGYLREPCSVMRPVVTFTPNPFSSNSFYNPARITYAYIATFDRYYWVEDWSWENGVWTCSMKVDVLATYRNNIGQSEQYILRTDSTSTFNGYITDTMYPATNNFSINEYIMQSPFTDDIEVGCFIVGIISSNSVSNVGAISYYAMSSAQFGDLNNTLLSDVNLEIMDIIDANGHSLITDMSQQVLKTMYNPFQYIVSCMWFPFDSDAIADTHTVYTIPIGWWDYNLSGELLYAQTQEFGETGPLIYHPQAGERGTYLNYAPYTRRTLLGRFGTVALDSSYYRIADHITISYLVDLITGKCLAKIGVYSQDPEEDDPEITIVAEREFLIGVPIQIAQIGRDYLGAISTAISAVSNITGSAVSGLATGSKGGAVLGAIDSTASGIYNTINSLMPIVETSGSNGTFIVAENDTRVLTQFFRIAEEDIEHKGRPLCETRRINTLSGYILCSDGELDLTAFEDERQAVNKFLTTGVFWE